MASFIDTSFSTTSFSTSSFDIGSSISNIITQKLELTLFSIENKNIILETVENINVIGRLRK